MYCYSLESWHSLARSELVAGNQYKTVSKLAKVVLF